ncbi:MAG: TetR/AcrR family transcriptional regulator [Rhodanobacteraceae bacterium]
MTRTNRRAECTRAAVREAFVALFFERGYDEISTTDVARRAGVGRSTFYEHFRGKEDLLLKTIHRPFEPLATLVDDKIDKTELRLALEHFWNHRRNSQVTRRESSRRAMARVLTGVLARRLRSRGESEARITLLSVVIAELLLGIIAAWLSGAIVISTTALTALLAGSVKALLASRVEDERVSNPSEMAAQSGRGPDSGRHRPPGV